MNTATLRGVEVILLSPPRRIAGGEVVRVTWARDSDRAEHILSNGSVHEAHRHGFTWEEPVLNLRDIRNEG